MKYEVLIKGLPAQTFTSVRRRVALAELSSYVEGSIAEMRRILLEAGVPEAGTPFAIFYEPVNETRAGEVEVCVPCSDSKLDDGVVERRSLPSMTVAYAAVPVERARYPEIVEAYDAVSERILRDGKLLGDAPRETYGEESTEVAWPIGGPAETTHAPP